MAFASGSVDGISGTATASFEVRAGANVRTKIIEITGHDAAASAPQRAFGRPAAAGTSPNNSQPLTFDNPADGLFTRTTVATGWAVVPTSPTIFHRRRSGNGGGSSIIFTFPFGFILAVGQTAVVWSVVSSGRGLWQIVVDE